MKGLRLLILLSVLIFLCACQSPGDRDTIAKLRTAPADLREETIEGGLEKAMESYQRFLTDTPESALTPEAIRRLADLKVEREYGYLTGGFASQSLPTSLDSTRADQGIGASSVHAALGSYRPEPLQARESEEFVHAPIFQESEDEFEKRMTEFPPGSVSPLDDLERAGTLEAIALYQKLLTDYPHYDRNDQVLYQMSRAYEELGRIEEAMDVMDRLVHEFPRSRYIDEVQFRRAEYFFTQRRWLDAEEAYASIAEMGVASSFYQLALYKLGWTFYKQDLYEDALHRFIALLDYKVSVGHDFSQTEDEPERKRLEDTFRVISLSFSNLGGPDSVVDYFSRFGRRGYEDGVYSNLGEFYFDKLRYADATATYNAFISRNPFHKRSPHFHMRVIEINIAGGFPSLVLQSKKDFATTYALTAPYWKHFEPSDHPEVLGYLKANLTDLANHYHALYQDPQHLEEKTENFNEALHWYREFLVSFPREIESPAINHQMADLLLENRFFAQAAVEYERTAYGYPLHASASAAGYAAIFAHREHLGVVSAPGREAVRREVVRSSLTFADTFPEHEKASIVLGAAADDLYDMKDFAGALAAATKLIEVFPGADTEVLRGAWLVSAHSSYELRHYADAESAYVNVLALLPPDDEARDGLIDNLAASIYRQGEEAIFLEDYRAAAGHFLRVGRMAPTSSIRVNAEYDAAAALIQLKDWEMAAAVLTAFRSAFPGHELQPEVTKKIAHVYREDGQLSKAAAEYERIERESDDEEVRREALLIAAELHEEARDSLRALAVYRRYAEYFPRPVELNLETRRKIADILKADNDEQGYLAELRRIVDIDASAGRQRTARTRHLAAHAGLVLAEPKYHQFVEVKLKKPFEQNLRRKRDLMRVATQEYVRLVDYEVAEITAAATFYLAEIYAHFSKALMESERPDDLSPLELEMYELAIEEQAYPFEEQAITVHQNNHELISLGIYNVWVERSMRRLAEMVPARYAKDEETSGVIASLGTYVFEIDRPAAAEPMVVEGAAEQNQAIVPVEQTLPAVGYSVIDEDAPVETAQIEETVQAEETVQTMIVKGKFTAEDAENVKAKQ